MCVTCEHTREQRRQCAPLARDGALHKLSDMSNTHMTYLDRGKLYVPDSMLTALTVGLGSTNTCASNVDTKP